MSEDVANLASSLEQIIVPDPEVAIPEAVDHQALGILTSRFYPELLDAVVAETKALIEKLGVPPAEIVIIWRRISLTRYAFPL